MSEISVVARLKIHPGKIEEFKSAAATCIATVREKDTDTLRYDWFLNDTQTECKVLEMYTSSEAVLTHVGNLGDHLAALLETCDFSGEIFGNPSQQLIAAFAPFETVGYTPM